MTTTSCDRRLRLGAGYPGQSFLAFSHWVHPGRLSSHFILRCLRSSSATRFYSRKGRIFQKEKEGGRRAYLQLLQPVLTLGLLVLFRLGLSSGLGVEPPSDVGVGGVPLLFGDNIGSAGAVVRLILCKMG